MSGVSNEVLNLNTENVLINNDFLQDDKPMFMPPAEAPVFCPNDEEFEDPLAYIAKIRPVAEKSGICKIRPPSHWKPPFAVDVDKMKFTPRIQKLNELDGQTRTKLNFLEKLAKFWELQGTALKIPIIEEKPLDLYSLHKTVQSKNGFVNVTELMKWSMISRLMGYRALKTVGKLLKFHYERLIFPFDLFNQNAEENAVFPNGKAKTSTWKKNSYERGVNDLLEQYVCRNCNKDDDEEYMLLCDGCDDGYHTYCLLPPLQGIPEGDWCCPKCVAEECSKPMDAFGFEQANREYTLQQFGEMADTFKSEYFKMNTYEVSTSTVEQEYWKIISSIEEDVTVEYGADLHAMDHGSGFPTMASKNLFPGDKEYAESPWNLNNLPVLEGSVLRYIAANVSGIKVPWMYVGMCFATFCWHSEDHWTYSINYLHWGEPKTWYAVPGDKAELFESAMKSAAPELFKSQPDLLHQLVTIINPNILMNVGVPVFRTDQLEGEFVVTFPRAFHAGFNQGYNFAEAVNFAPADWLKLGRQCLQDYSISKRFCVFSHDELICKMASDPDKLTHDVATASYEDMLVMVESEKKLRKKLLEWGVKKCDRVVFELKPDDERQCEVCKTTCFLSAVSCKCSPNVLLCLRHYRKLCECTPLDKILKYRYTLNELPVLLKRLKLKSKYFDEWTSEVRLILDPNSSKKVFLEELKNLLNQALLKKYPKGEYFQQLNETVKKAEKFASIIHQLNVYKERSKHSNINVTRITLDELRVFEEEIKSLPCFIKEIKYIEELFSQAEIFEKTSSLLLSEPMDSSQIPKLTICKEFGVNIGVELPNLQNIVSRLARLQWLEDVKHFKRLTHVMTMENIKNLVDEGSRLTLDPELEEELSALKGLLKKSKAWEKKAYNVLHSKSKSVLLQAEELFQEASNITCFLPTEGILYEAVEKAREWLTLLEETTLAERCPSLENVKNLVERGKQLTICLAEVEKMERQLELAITWKEKVCNIFMKENSNKSLVELLTPRTIDMSIFNDHTTNSSALVTIYKEAESTELVMMKNLRQQNLLKTMNNYFCVCSGRVQDIMLQCELCKDWFHSACLSEADMNSIGYKFLCPTCKRTKRPDKDVVFVQLLALRDLYVRVPEGDVLQCLAERALNWQARAKTMLENLRKYETNSVHFIDLAERTQIEEMVIEGDLLEISMVESSTLWNTFRAIEQKSNSIDVSHCFNPVNDVIDLIDDNDLQLDVPRDFCENRMNINEIIEVDSDSDDDMNNFGEIMDDIDQEIRHEVVNVRFSHDSGLGDEEIWTSDDL